MTDMEDNYKVEIIKRGDESRTRVTDTKTGLCLEVIGTTDRDEAIKAFEAKKNSKEAKPWDDFTRWFDA